ncbi:MAG TPA: DUF6600 domain-containing protein [Chthonomonadaceae bacterium]|nr:DUF6600 domain-containing protein [Chthonomonadaceae bacterium]
MRNPRFKPPFWFLVFCLALGTALLPGAAARAQSDDDPAYASETVAPDDAVQSNPADSGPVRMARFSYVSGDVTWRGDGMDSWTPGAMNMPLRQGAQIGVTNNGRAEIQFDDGSLLRLGRGAVATLQTLYSDSQGEFTEIKLNDGLAALRLRGSHSIYQIDTPVASLKAEGPAKIRIGVGDGAEFAVTEGQAVVEGAQGRATLHSGDYLDLLNGDSAFQVESIPGADSWDRWNDERDRYLAEGSRQSDRYLPPNIAISAGDLDYYGSWRDDPSYGHVWCPRESASWRPYYEGHWVWVEPFGWTWCGNEPWGWAPYHYGTWIYRPWGWEWIPGPAYQYWCPAVVDFCTYDGYVAWAPLCPAEVHYPASFSLGVWGRNWFLSFAIGEAGCYYPYGGSSVNISFFFGHAWDNHYVNFYHSGYGHEGFGGFGPGHGNAFTATHFLPYNVTHGAGGVIAQMNAFGGTGSYRPLPHGETSFFTHGQTIGLPSGHRPFSGPMSIRPSQIAMSPTRTFAGFRPSQSILTRPVVRATLPPAVARESRPFGPAVTPHSQSGASRYGGYQSASGRRQSSNPPMISNRTSSGSYPRGGSSAQSNAPAWERARQTLGERPSSSGYGESAGRSRNSSSYQTFSAPGSESRARSNRPVETNNSAAAALRARQSLGGYSPNPRYGGSSGYAPYGRGNDSSGSRGGYPSSGYGSTPYRGRQDNTPYGRDYGNQSNSRSRDRSEPPSYSSPYRGRQDTAPSGRDYNPGGSRDRYMPPSYRDNSPSYSGRGGSSYDSGTSRGGYSGSSGSYNRDPWSGPGSHSYGNGSYGRGSTYDRNSGSYGHGYSYGGSSGGRSSSDGGRSYSGGGRSYSGGGRSYSGSGRSDSGSSHSSGHSDRDHSHH